MSFARAFDILMSRGWDYYGALAILTTLAEDGLMEDMTVEKLVALSDDYADR